MRRHLCVQLLPRLRTGGCRPRPLLRIPALARGLSTGNKNSRRNECTAAASYVLPGGDASETRPFAVERVGGRECHISWSSEGQSGIEKEWRDIVSAEAAEGKIAAPTNSLTGRISSWLGQMFLPTNYPESVHRSYLSFHVLQFFETTLATITSVLCNQALLTSVGVSAEGSFFGAVAVQWIIKDGAGEVAKLFFIKRFSPFFDSHPKTFTLFGEVLGCLGSGLQIATVLIAPSPLNFVLCAAGGNIFKLVGSAIWYTTHIKFMRYFSMQGNDGDVAAKDESQASIAQLAGYAAGISLLTFSHSPAYLYSIFFTAVPLHLTMTVYMMRNASFELLTLPRVSHLAQTYITEGTVDSVDSLDQKGATGLFGEFYKNKSDCWLTLAPRVSDVLSAGSEVDRSRWEVCSKVFQHERYLLFPCDTPRGPQVSVFFHPDATNEDMLRSILHAAMVRSVLLKSTPWPGPEPALRSILIDTHEWTHHDFPAFKQALEEQKWRTNELCFADLGHRVTWTP
ncbi:DUF647-domain-containing protein [Lentinus tigrinus ALCF2SS1-7]|uniref:DUF647-domain-containing protein n=1 Tax=Lentinus tigrinus ALCF2SS1-6 TaxID=1328759 RepID=A0A5C2S8V7_9APHY|nr:DUF647-domain-containing protein [Lentinus tigrinus ALCF2SS1-6]RPD74994.1 DUF647-domain-containing protein [Lentinus tigrinus ALCF2SS1-7]